MRMRVSAVASLLGGDLRGDASVLVSGAEVDSRLVKEGDLFVALQGARTDGHAFLGPALETASAALVRRGTDLPPVAPGRALIAVDDPLAAYHRLASHDRSRRQWRVLAVTGSVGKTTTKDMLAALLGETLTTGYSEGNRNSTLGLPAQLLSQPEDTAVFVAETGMSRSGELDLLGAILRPDLVLYTRITSAHTEFFDGIEGVVEAKAELLRHLDHNGVLVINGNDPHQRTFPERCGARVVRYGGGDGEARLEQVEDLGLEGTRGVLVLASGRAPFELPLAGRHNAENFLAAAAAAGTLGVTAAEAGQRASRLRPAKHRGEIVRLPGGITIVDDSYNASPSAVACALDLLATARGRRIAVLGEMFELGPAAAREHHQIGIRAASACHELLAVGGAMAERFLNGARAAGMPSDRTRHVASAAAAAEELQSMMEDGDTVLVKGSRGIGLDATVAALIRGGGA